LKYSLTFYLCREEDVGRQAKNINNYINNQAYL
jgi:hypothetical protein